MNRLDSPYSFSHPSHIPRASTSNQVNSAHNTGVKRTASAILKEASELEEPTRKKLSSVDLNKHSVVPFLTLIPTIQVKSQKEQLKFWEQYVSVCKTFLTANLPQQKVEHIALNQACAEREIVILKTSNATSDRETQLNLLKSSKERLEEKNSAKRKEIKTLSSKIDRLHNEVNALKKSNEELADSKRRIRDLQKSDVARKERHISSLKNELNDLKTQISSLESVLSFRNFERIGLVTELNEVTERRVSESETKTDELSKLLIEVGAQARNIDRLLANNDEINGKYKEAQRLLQAEKSRTEKLTKEKSHLSKELKEAKISLELEQLSVKFQERQIESLQKEHDSYQNTIASYEDLIQESHVELETSRDLLTQTQSSIEAFQVAQELSLLSESEGTQKEEEFSSFLVSQRNSVRIRELSAENRALDSVNEKLHENMVKLQGINHELETDNEDFMAKNDLLEEEIEKLKEQLEELKNLSQTSNASKKSFKPSASQNPAKIIADLQKQLDSANAENIRLTRKLERSERNSKRL